LNTLEQIAKGVEATRRDIFATIQRDEEMTQLLIEAAQGNPAEISLAKLEHMIRLEQMNEKLRQANVLRTKIREQKSQELRRRWFAQ